MKEVYGLPFVRYRDFPKNKPFPLVIKKISNGMLFNRKYIKLEAFLPFDRGHRSFDVIFPLYKFRSAYLSLPIDIRRNIGNYNIYLVFTKGERGNLLINKIEKYNPDIHK